MQNIDESYDNQFFVKNDGSRRLRAFEFFVWFGLSNLILVPLCKDLMKGSGTFEAVEAELTRVMLAIFIMLAPSLYRLVFSKSLLYSFFASFYKTDSRGKLVELQSTLEIKAALLEREIYEESSAEHLLIRFALNSKKLAREIFTRAGVFLFVGVVIAFIGVAFFYISTTRTGINGDLPSTLTNLAPTFGILFFIEFIALFFLRLYRSAMDEFRYYESLQRSREETLAIVKLMNVNGEKINIYQLVEKCGFRSSIEKLGGGQSTDLIESKKLTKDETEIFNKILDILGKK